MINFDVFISYSSKDKAAADASCAALESAGVRCWMAPRDITPGTDWGEAIMMALDHCRAMVLIFSASANSSPQIRREIERAVNRGVPILPVRIEDIVPTKALAYFMGPVHWLDAMTPPLDSHLRRLAEVAKTILRPAPDTSRRRRGAPGSSRSAGIGYSHADASLRLASPRRACRRNKNRPRPPNQRIRLRSRNLAPGHRQPPSLSRSLLPPSWPCWAWDLAAGQL